MITVQHAAKEDKKIFCLLFEIWNNFIENCKKCYVPNFDLTIEEQLFPCMPKKPDKFGIKFRLLVNVCSKYLCNGKPYLGKDPTRNREKDLPTDFCLWLMQLFLKKGYNVTMNNYFTSINLANKLKVEKNYTSWNNKKRRGTKVEEMMKGKPLYILKIYQSPFNATSTIHVYKAKNQS